MAGTSKTQNDFEPARALVDYVRAPSADPELLRALLVALKEMAEALPQDTDADPDSDAEAPTQDPNGVLNLLVTNLPFLALESAQQLALVMIDVVETLWYLEHVSEQEAVWYCRFGFGCHWGLRLEMVIDALDPQRA